MTVLDHTTTLHPQQRPAAPPRARRAGLTALARGLGVLLTDDPWGAGAPVIDTDHRGLDDVLARLRQRLTAGRALVVLHPAVDEQLLVVPDDENPIVFRAVVDAVTAGTARAAGRGPSAALRLRLHDAVAVEAGVPLALNDAPASVPVVATVIAGMTHVTIVGSASIVDDRVLPLADNAALVGWAIAGSDDGERCRNIVRQLRTTTPVDHPEPPVIELTEDDREWLDRLRAAVPAGVAVDDEAFATAAARAARLLPPAVHDALVDFADSSHPSGAMVIRGLPVGDVPATPGSPRQRTDKDHVSELVLLTVGRRLGQPIGYEPEHGGQLVQNLVPTASAASTQTSTSSAVMLEFHTEAAFHPHKPRFLLLLGLRADPFGEARTLLCSIDAVIDSLSLGCRAVLAQPRFRTGVDESYTNGRTGRLGRPVPVLSGDPDRPTLTFDADLMVGVDTEAEDALQELRRAVREHHIGVALAPGDLLVVDNHAAVHGRSPFRARYDGADRWLQRSFVVTDLAASAGERRGRVITTRFA